MGNVNGSLTRQVFRKFLAPVGLAMSLLATSANADFTVSVYDEQGTAILGGFKWVLEEDPTFQVQPGVQTQDSLGVAFHRSYAPVVSTGEVNSNTSPLPHTTIIPSDSTKRYFLSILPFSGMQMTGVKVDPESMAINGGNYTVTANSTPVPTALISVLVFPDTFKVNGVFDLPQEVPVNDPTSPDYNGFDPTKFSVELYDPAGQVFYDAFGNLIGTKYDASGAIIQAGTGVSTPDINGRLVIRNLTPGKYGVRVTPPAPCDPNNPNIHCDPNLSESDIWQQTSTIEGGPAVDSWVQENEAEWFVEFGPPGQHVFIGFVQPTNNLPELAATTPILPVHTITGNIANQHMARPPEMGFYAGNPFPNCWIALQPGLGQAGAVYYAQPCNTDSSFSIPGVKEGLYQLVVWDTALNVLLATRSVSVPADLNQIAAEPVQVFNWFGRLEAVVYDDANLNGLRDAGEGALPEQNINIRFRDGRIYQAFPTDLGGEAPFDQVFPFFHWLVAEVDFATRKATGVTYIVDGGGPVTPDLGWQHPSRDKLNPQIQPTLNPATLNFKSTTITPPPGEIGTLTLAFQSFLGTTNIMEFGKAPYLEGENGGISGIVFYAVTRAEGDPALAAAEPWEPGIPRVQVNLYQGYVDPANPLATPTQIDDINGEPGIQLADIDNYPFGWSSGGAMGNEDVDYNVNGIFDLGDAIDFAITDSWDDSNPTGCVGEVFTAHPGTPIEKATDCYDGFRNFNQVREGVFDGGYAFPPMASGYYIVEATTPPGYEILKEEDVNVDFGEAFIPSPLLLPPACVGDIRTLTAPMYLSFQTGADGLPLPGIALPDLVEVDAAFLGDRPLCDRKVVTLTDGKNAAADFFLFTDVPVSAHVTGSSLNDLANEFDPNNPSFGEKQGMAWMPVVFRDWTGRKVTKVYTDEFGRYNVLLPSTYSINVASPTGVSPNVLSACLNDQDVEIDPITGEATVDPNYRSNFSTTCYNLEYTPGATTYLDTPVVPIAAFAGGTGFPVDCSMPDQTPGIYSVSGPGNAGPFIPAGTLDGAPARNLTITSNGIQTVPNPDWDGTNIVPSTISRDYGFGVAMGTVTMNGTSLPIVSWTDASIEVTVPSIVSTGTLTVTNANGATSQAGVTVTTDMPATSVVNVQAVTGLSGKAIQTAIDNANPGDLILVEPGVYWEILIMHKPVKIQGYGAGSTVVNGLKQPASKLIDWRQKIVDLYLNDVGAPLFDLIGAQAPQVQLRPTDPLLFQSEEGSTILVVSTDASTRPGDSNADWGQFNPRIDGLTISGGEQGGGILVNGFAHNIEISNNVITSNSGSFSGGIRIGNRLFSGNTDSVSIHNNMITTNGTTAGGGSGGGVSIHAGTNNYAVTDNFICGNFSQGNGAGIGHEGLSDNGLIANNTIVFNHSFSQALDPDGGGILIAGIARAAGPSDGAGSVTIDSNHIEGNQAGSGFGGGIALRSINGVDIQANPSTPGAWYTINIYDNNIVANVAGNAGGGISLADAASVNIINNTIAHNDSTATTGVNFVNATTTAMQPGAGVAAQLHSTALNIAGFSQTYANPNLVNNIVWQNRSFSWQIDNTVTPAVFGLTPATGVLGLDLAVIGGGLIVPAAELNPVNSVLTSLSNNSGGSYAASNVATDPLFANGFNNGNRGTAIGQIEQTIPNTAPALDEGGNFVDVAYGPLTMLRDYHIASANSGAIDIGLDTSAAVGADRDGDSRPQGVAVDAGADEVPAATVDADSDGVFDVYDNCTLAANATQVDADGDGFGNICDPDLNNDGIVNTGDLNIFRGLLFSADPVADFNSDGTVNTGDLNIMRSYLFQPPGPSGIAP